MSGFENGVVIGIAWILALELALITVYYYRNRKGRDGMPLNLSVVRSKHLPAKAEYMDALIRVDYKPGIITPAWSASLGAANESSADDFVDKVLEVVHSWDLEENAETEFTPESEYYVGDLILADRPNGRAYRVVHIDPHKVIEGEGQDKEEVVKDYGLSNGMPDEWPETKGEQTLSGGVTLECIGSADEAYTIPLTRRAVGNVPGPVLGQIINGIMTAANTGADEQKRG